MPKKLPGRCVFCDRPGLTDEHLLPNKWMRKVFPRPPFSTREWSTKVTRGPLPASRTREIKQGSIFSQKFHIACRPCNDGWMHTLEDTACPVLLRLISGQVGIGLTTDGQRLLSRWLVKTTMVAEHAMPAEVTFTSDDRRKMKESLEIPRNCYVWIASTTGQRWKAAIEHLSVHNLPLFSPIPNTPLMPPIDAQVTFFGLNTFLGIVFSWSTAANLVVKLDPHHEWITGLHQIWPIIKPVMPVPMFSLRDVEVDAAHGWFEEFLHPSRVRPPP
jgi:hypothetical protein